MATLDENDFGIVLSNVPIINNRIDFNNVLALFRDATFRKQFKGYKGNQIPIKTHYFTWHGRPNTLLTYLLRDAIVGLESAVSSAIFIEALDLNLMTEEVMKAIKNPFSLGGRSTAECVYNMLPKLINEKFTLKNANNKLWSKTKNFYTKIRNPIFHGYEISKTDPGPVWECLELLWLIYKWLNTWHPVEKILDGPIAWNPELANRIRNIPCISDIRIKQIIPERSLPENGREYLECLPDDMSLFQIEDILGIYVCSEEMLDITMSDHENKNVKMLLSPNSAMKLLGYLALAQRHRGWELPDRL